MSHKNFNIIAFEMTAKYLSLACAIYKYASNRNA